MITPCLYCHIYWIYCVPIFVTLITNSGRMAPPVEEAQTKVVKVATTVVRRQSTKADEEKNTTLPAMDDDLHLTVLEDSFRNAQSGYEGRSVVICDTMFLVC